ncbi:hypothetical protein CGMCC3_g1211 [Colletotrichum fructicola]|nr:uncharacterized protein CGMCC3_g1211 [Colletotrichum fructicola]KAE9583220.1 hypothetical protein CGMCC3_g1211 [Colletotrichum fructicola]
MTRTVGSLFHPSGPVASGKTWASWRTPLSQRERPIKQTANGDIGTELTNSGQWTAPYCEARPCRRCATQHTWWTAAYCKRPIFLDGGRMTADEGFVTGNVDNVQLAEKGRQQAGKCWLPDVIRRIEVERAPRCGIWVEYAEDLEVASPTCNRQHYAQE